MKKKFNIPIIFIVLSLLWLAYFGFRFFQFQNINKELTRINENAQYIDNQLFYERTVRNLEIEYDNVSRQTFTTTSTSEFIAKLPKIAEMSGIRSMEIENSGVTVENGLEITSLNIKTVSLFPDVANFIDILERARLPILIASLDMIAQDGSVVTTMSMRIYKKIIEG
jgi:hypothetical protein